MLKSKDKNRISRLIWIDALACAMILATMAGVCWYLFLRDDSAGREVSRLQVRLTALRRELTETRTAIAEQQDMIVATELELSRHGRLPLRTPVEKDLQLIIELARAHQIDVLEVHPAASVEYPGLLEMRFSLEAAARAVDLIRFMRELQSHSVWADISYLSIAQSGTRIRPGSDQRAIQMTVSLFSSPAEDEAPRGTGRG